jgi:hypothetical protein
MGFCAPRYHGGVAKNFTVRLPDDVAADTAAMARVEGISLNEAVKRSLIDSVQQRRRDPKFQQRLRQILQEDKELLDRLAK